MKPVTALWVLLGLASVPLGVACAADAPQALKREFVMHTAESTASSPHCVLVTQRVTQVVQVEDLSGNLSNLPVIRSYFKPANCTAEAIPYEQEPGTGVGSRITSEKTPWHKL